MRRPARPSSPTRRRRPRWASPSTPCPQQYGIDGLEHYEYLWYGSPVTEISSACGAYTLYYRPLTAAEIAQNDFLELVQQGQATFEEYMQQDFWLDFQGENERKLTSCSATRPSAAFPARRRRRPA